MFRRNHNRIKSYWWNSRPNFGDQLAPLLLSRFADIDVQWDTISHSQLVTVGSILEHVPPLWDGYILGAGKLFDNSRLYIGSARTLGVRGPLSARGLKGNLVLADPGLLADELIAPQTRTIDLGIVPHWSDKKLAHDPRFTGHKWSTVIIDPASDPLNVITAIGQCKKIVSSSLHGLIVADAWGIPRRFEYCHGFDGEGGQFKFNDYSASIDAAIEPGKLFLANRNLIENKKHQLWDAYRELGSILRY